MNPRVSDMLDSAEHMPHSPRSQELMRAALREAERLGDLEGQIAAHSMILHTAGEVEDIDALLTSMGWLTAQEDADPGSVDLHLLLWMHKSAIHTLCETPWVSLAQIQAFLEAFERRATQAGYGLEGLAKFRIVVAQKTYDTARAAELAREWSPDARNPLSDCLACDTRFKGWVLVDQGRHEEALAWFARQLTAEVNCSSEPESSATSTMETLVELGRVEEALPLHAQHWPQIRRQAVPAIGSVHAHVRILAATGNLDRALRCWNDVVDRMGLVGSQRDRLFTLRALLTLLSALEAVGRGQDSIRIPANHLSGDRARDTSTRTLSVSEARLLVATQAEAIATALDARNGNTGESEDLARELDILGRLPQLPWTLARRELVEENATTLDLDAPHPTPGVSTTPRVPRLRELDPAWTPAEVLLDQAFTLHEREDPTALDILEQVLDPASGASKLERARARWMRAEMEVSQMEDGELTHLMDLHAELVTELDANDPVARFWLALRRAEAIAEHSNDPGLEADAWAQAAVAAAPEELPRYFERAALGFAMHRRLDYLEGAERERVRDQAWELLMEMPARAAHVMFSETLEFAQYGELEAALERSNDAFELLLGQEELDRPGLRVLARGSGLRAQVMRAGELGSPIESHMIGAAAARELGDMEGVCRHVLTAGEDFLASNEPERALALAFDLRRELIEADDAMRERFFGPLNQLIAQALEHSGRTEEALEIVRSMIEERVLAGELVGAISGHGWASHLLHTMGDGYGAVSELRAALGRIEGMRERNEEIPAGVESDISTRLGEMLWRIDANDEAEELLRATLTALATQDDPEQELTTLCTLQDVVGEHRPAEALTILPQMEAVLDRLAERAEPESPEALHWSWRRARVWVVCAHIALNVEDHTRVMELAAKARDLFTELGDIDGLATTHDLDGQALVSQDRVRDALDLTTAVLDQLLPVDAASTRADRELTGRLLQLRSWLHARNDDEAAADADAELLRALEDE